MAETFAKDSCAFCTEVRGRERIIVAENDLAYAFPTNMPIVPGHMLVIPKRCIPSIDQMTSEERAAVLGLAEQVRRALRTALGAEGFNVAWNDGAIAGQSVPHFHLHLVPRKAGDAGITEYEPRQFLYRPGSRAQSPEDELALVANLVRECLQ